MTRSERFRDRCERLPGVDLRTISRDREFVAMKKAFANLCYEYYSDTDTLKMIGSLMGRDHSTVHYYVYRTRSMKKSVPKRYRIEKHWYDTFETLVHFTTPTKQVRFNSPAGRIQINMLWGVL